MKRKVKRGIAKPSHRHSNAGSKVKGSEKMGFVTFVTARQAVLLARRAGLPSDKWTGDPVLGRARFCNIDRRDDAVTAELLDQIRDRPAWGVRDCVLLAAALRFTGSRRGEAAVLGHLVKAGRSHTDCSPTPLCVALEAGQVRCGAGTYQLSLNRQQVASVIEAMADAIAARVAKNGPFVDVLEASDCVASLMTVGKRPQFSANETAKDFAYFAGLMQPGAEHRCRLGPGARKGLALVRAAEGHTYCGDEHTTISMLRAALREVPSLAWVEEIDVEQALCEFSKYESYCTNGISASKRYEPPPA